MSTKLTDFKCLVFNCYGTLVDWESGIITAFQPLRSRANKTAADSSTSRTDLLKLFVQVESAIQSTKPTMLYADVLAKAHSTIASGHFGLPPPSAEEDAAFGASIANWEPFSDTRGALRRLSKHYKLVILSNVDRASFAHTKRKLEEGSGFTFDSILTAQDIGSYKPDLRNFQFAFRRVKEEWGVEFGQVLPIAQSLFHDHVPANKLGLKSSWIARRGSVVGAKESNLEEQGVKVTYTCRFETLGAMAEEVERQFGESG